MEKREFKPSTLEERKEFYEKEFSIKKVKSWFRKNNLEYPQLCAIDAGTETGIIINKKLKGIMLYFPLKDLQKKIKKYIPEDVYYDRNKYKNWKQTLRTLNFKDKISQELVFDIDADNIKCKNKHPKGVCALCLSKAYKYTIAMKKDLEKTFRKVKIIYSDRGFHLHVLDKKAFLMSDEERKALGKRYSKYPIDPWISEGKIRLIRMPFSLNALVSRITMPINNFNKIKNIPRFLRG